MLSNQANNSKNYMQTEQETVSPDKANNKVATPLSELN